MVQPLGLSIHGTGTNQTRLSFGNMTDGEVLVLSGNTITTQPTSGGSTPTGPAGGDLDGTYPNPEVIAAQFDSSRLTFGAVSITQMLVRNGSQIVGIDQPGLPEILARDRTTGGYDIYMSSGSEIRSYVSTPITLEAGAFGNFSATGDQASVTSRNGPLNLTSTSEIILSSSSTDLVNIHTPNTTSDSDRIYIGTGGCSTGGNSGSINIFSGAVTSGATGSGYIAIHTSNNNSVTGTSGPITILTGEGHAGNSGGIYVSTGSGGGGTTGSGEIRLTTGSGASGSTGHISFHTGSRGAGAIGRVYGYQYISGDAHLYQSLAYAEVGDLYS